MYGSAFRVRDQTAARLQTGIAPGDKAFEKRILFLSVLSLVVPLATSIFFPEWISEDSGMLVWLLALVPAFLLSYHHGWRGSSLALAAAMAFFSVGQAVLVWKGLEPPPFQVLFTAVVILLVVTLGSGWLSTALHDALNDARQLALTDRGTMLPNRSHAAIHLDRAFAAARRGNDLSVVVFDLDHFKSINDRFGHATGDQVLADFAAVLRKMTRGMNLSARIGGEEFVSILDNVKAEGAEIFAGRVLEQMRARSYHWGSVTVSAGIAEYEEGMASPDVLVAAADEALYRAKRAGRDRIHVLGRPEVVAAPVPPPVTAEDGKRRGRGELLLVVDDDAAVLRMLKRSLQKLDYDVMDAASPEEALQVVSALKEKVDLVVTDMVMPTMSGFRLVDMLAERQPDLRALYISGFDDRDIDWTDAPGAVHGFLQKPLTQEALAAAVRDALDAPADPRETVAALAG